jgi:hypothetical protein
MSLLRRIIYLISSSNSNDHRLLLPRWLYDKAWTIVSRPVGARQFAPKHLRSRDMFDMSDYSNRRKLCRRRDEK